MIGRESNRSWTLCGCLNSLPESVSPRQVSEVTHLVLVLMNRGEGQSEENRCEGLVDECKTLRVAER